jgi:hypothetical protein
MPRMDQGDPSRKGLTHQADHGIGSLSLLLIVIRLCSTVGAPVMHGASFGLLRGLVDGIHRRREMTSNMTTTVTATTTASCCSGLLVTLSLSGPR